MWPSLETKNPEPEPAGTTLSLSGVNFLGFFFLGFSAIFFSSSFFFFSSAILISSSFFLNKIGSAATFAFSREV